ncbi:putative xyloglucan-specific endo-beta-1,4-glucanase A [Metarhizium anisopliae]|nr:putative xyloglucan-specific endo-beta-1,4-glucanase A [Metarhizium anisopliae]
MLRWLVSAVFLALPIATTIGVLLGMQAYNHAKGRPPPFSGGDDGNGLPGIGTPKGKDTVEIKCDQAFGFDPKSKGQNFICESLDIHAQFALRFLLLLFFGAVLPTSTQNANHLTLTADNLLSQVNPNPWGWKKGEEGALCMLVNFNGNRTYATEFSAPVFNTTWQYPRVTGGGNNVHAFPNAKVDSKNFPVQIGSVSKFEFDVEWSLSLKNDTHEEVTDADVTANQINANVAIDMFMDKDSTKAEDSEKAGFEVMVWFADFGTDAWPLGKKNTPDKGLVKSQTLEGVEFELYSGLNSQNQMVLSWVATKPTTTFKGDLKPLMDTIFAMNNANYPQKTDYLGYLAFGQEAYSSTANVTFSVPSLAVDIETST